MTDSDNFILTMAVANTEGGAGITTAGTATFKFQLENEPAVQTYGYGWGN